VIILVLNFLVIELLSICFPFITCLILLHIVYSTLDEAKLKEKGRAFHDMFLTKVSLS